MIAIAKGKIQAIDRQVVAKGCPVSRPLTQD